jgi:SAM-dependent methyltransferase
MSFTSPAATGVFLLRVRVAGCGRGWNDYGWRAAAGRLVRQASVNMQTSNNQRKIWEFHQNENVEAFSGAGPRLQGLARATFRLARRQKILKPAILNIGVGNGHFEEFILRGGGNPYSIDPDVRPLVRLAEKGVKCYAASIEHLPIAEKALDFVVVSEVLEHLDDAERRNGLAEIRRILKPGGYILGTVPYRENLQQNITICPHCGEVFHRWGHKKGFDLGDIKQELRPHFKIERVTRTAFVSFPRNSTAALVSVVRFVLAKLGKAIAVPSIYFVARRDS